MIFEFPLKTLSISTLYIDQQVVDNIHVRFIQSRIDAPVFIVDDVQKVFQSVLRADDPVKVGKESLFLTINRGNFVRKCPGTRFYTCCGYYILNIGTFCTMDCSYCILQIYFHPPILQFFVNYQDMLQELQTLFSTKKLTRIGTGEFTDSLIWENWTDLSRFLITNFSTQSSAVLELKTKTTAVEKLGRLRHNRKTIIAWSLNTELIIRNEEHRTAPLSARLNAAAKCELWGYPLAFHFDPMIIYDGCEADYRQVVEALFSCISPDNIVWISLGTFRFIPSLKTIIQKRFPKSKIIYGEFIPGIDGKMRYFKALRIDLYCKIVSWIREMAPNLLIYFCMEDDEVWKRVLGFVPSEHGGLSKMLDDRARLICGLDR